MCGRYSQSLPIDQLKARFDAAVSDALVPSPEIFPTQSAAVVIQEGRRELRAMRWGLVPSWAKDLSFGRKTFNARAETAAEKPSFREAFRKRRCLVPADAFFEWRDKKRLTLRRKDGEPFAFAGLWERWRGPEREVLSFTILTVAANADIASFHDRMPATLARDEEQDWLESGPAALLRPCAPGLLSIE